MRAPTLPASTPHPPDEKKSRLVESNNSKPTHSNGFKAPTTSPRKPVAQPKNLGERSQPDYVATAIEGLSLVKDADTASGGLQSAGSGESLEDDQSHLSTSSMKQQSFDTKSMASVTTFAMDEKESIRPDDSASVRAVEDDETSSVPQKEDTSALNARQSLRPSTSGVTIATRRYHTLTLTNPPQFGDLPVPIVQAEQPEPAPSSESSSEQQADPHERAPSLPLAPDEKLLDALASAKDRLPLLQLEEKFLALIANPSTQFFDLPPQNSFARLLAHKLADYYSLAHHINEDGTSIRVFRTPNPTLPTPLHVLARSIPAGPLQPPSAATFKIMRRAGLGPQHGSAGASTPASSSGPSKATSEAGLETTSEEGIMSPIEGTPNKDKSKPTREEREAQYKAARERIFGDFQESVTSESASTGENSASMSRSSSSSGKRKARKQKTPKDDSFEARSAYVPSYAPMHMANMQSQYQTHYSDQGYQGAYQNPTNGYGGNINYGTTPTQAYPGFDQTMSYNNAPMGYGPANTQPFSAADSWSSMQTPPNSGYYNYSASPNNYQQSMPPMLNQMNSQYLPQSHPGMQQPQNWMNNQYQASYPQPQGQGNPNVNGWSGYQPNQGMNNPVPYGYGQMPSQNFGSNPNQPYNAQYANQSTYSRSLFNPQTRSFVPSNTTSRNGGRNVRKKPSPASSQAQSRNNSVVAASRSYSSENSGTPPPPSTRGFERGITVNASSPQQRVPFKEDSLQQKYGAPAHLPKKPPPSQVLSSYDVENLSNTAIAVSSVTPNSQTAAIPSGARGTATNGASGPAMEQANAPSG
ncbi:hypothetical protein G647_05398 [Cladophialophora carrionii CBS 160.54]|uniref:R3H domain-containing protein n=1 Tax=Cladophialophora carrionii CBS 160.54 TaxID=1279043 RepID=V9DA85_9EURO|nr:uncharacterized protein G647_05398 [Cladophialophora carrionii CBS 160.54]ETI23596.1 hypothetical protein G647_05398 [Cladophialophora carrionii CBS 160.54]